MDIKELEHQSSISKQYLMLNKAVTIIHSQGMQGIKRGNLIIACEAPLNQWQYYHQILVDLDDIEWDKSNHIYRSLKSKVSKNWKA